MFRLTSVSTNTAWAVLSLSASLFGGAVLADLPGSLSVFLPAADIFYNPAFAKYGAASPPLLQQRSTTRQIKPAHTARGAVVQRSAVVGSVRPLIVKKQRGNEEGIDTPRAASPTNENEASEVPGRNLTGEKCTPSTRQALSRSRRLCSSLAVLAKSSSFGAPCMCTLFCAIRGYSSRGYRLYPIGEHLEKCLHVCTDAHTHRDTGRHSSLSPFSLPLALARKRRKQAPEIRREQVSRLLGAPERLGPRSG